MAVIFNCAMRWGLLDLGVNPVALVRVKGISRRQTEPRILNSDEIQTLISGLAEPCRTAVIVALSTGLRCSELFALKWLDFDWEQLTVLVRRAIVDGVGWGRENQILAVWIALGSGAGRGPVQLEA